MVKYLNSKVTSIPKSVIGELQAICANEKGIIPLSIGEPDFDTPWHIREEAIYALKDNKTHYTVSNGTSELRREICNYLYRRFGLIYKEDEVMATFGASEAIDLIFRCVLDEGDEVILPKPSYVAYEPSITLSSGKVVPIELKEENNFKLKKEDLLKAISPKTKVILLNFPSNPTGGIMSEEDYAEIVPIIKESGILVISDEIYAELTYGAKHCSIASFKEIKDQVLLVSGFSKAYAMTGWRLGYVCGNKELLSAIKGIKDYTSMSPTTFVQSGAIEALKQGDKDIEKMALEFERRKNYVVSKLNDMGLTCSCPEGAFYAFPNISITGMDGKEFSMRLVKEKKVAVVPGVAFGDNCLNNIRISYASKMEDIKEALNRIEEFVKENKKED